MQYQEYINNKLKINSENLIKEVDKSKLNKNLFDFQKDIVVRALQKGKYAIFAECGLGKTLMQLSWADYIVEEFNKPVLIICPLAVAQQTILEGVKFECKNKVYELKKAENIENNIYICNYEYLDNIDCSKFIAVILDESSILKNQTGAYRTKIIESFKNTKFKLCCTATPSPNDPMELGNHSEFLNQLPYNQVLSKYFVHDGGETQKWRLKGHGENDFWKFVSTWACMISNPEDLGYNQVSFKLPELKIENIQIETDKKDNGQLFNDTAVDSISFNRELRRTIESRLNKVVEIVNNSKENFIIWTKLNDEGTYLKKLIPNAVEVAGNDREDIKEKNLLDFAKNKFRVLITKPKIAQFGLNYQNCHNQIFCSMDFSFEGTYQAIRRSYRFGQKEKVNIRLITTDTMHNVINIFKEKEESFKIMQNKMCKYFNYISKGIVMNKSERTTYESENYKIMLGDCCERIKEIKDKSIDFSIFSPPFADLYTYSDSPMDMGNCQSYEDFAIHFEFLVKELSRVIADGRLVAIHCADLPIQKGKFGFIGLRDFSGLIHKLFIENGFIYHTRVTIWKDPVVEMQRTKALGLLHKQVKKDSSMSRVGIPDYLMVFRKSGLNLKPITNVDMTVDEWQKIASPVWMDINYSKTLQFTTARNEKDEKHICPLQLETISRAIKLWSNKEDTVFSPFLGIGSEIYQALKMDRKGIGIELKESYFNVAKDNIESVINQNKFNF